MATSAITKFNEQDYEVVIYLDCSDGQSTETQYNVNPNAIVNLNIEETLADWVTKGTLTIYDTFDSLENRPFTTGELGEASRYVFRNDGNDLLVIKIFPRFDNTGLDVERVHWELVYKFAIYDVEDIDLPPGAQGAASAATKCKKFYFWDHLYQKMLTYTMQYSTGLSSKADSVTRAIPTGEAMKEIIQEALLPYQIDTGSIIGSSNSDWDIGATNIFYTAPASNTAYDTLMDVYSRHVSTAKYSYSPIQSAPRGGTKGTSDNDFCVLYKERGPSEGQEGYLCLRPMSNFFEKAGKDSPKEFQIERFYIQDYSLDDSEIPNASYSPKSDDQNMQVDTKLGAYSQITSYRFVDISPFINSTKFCNHPVYSFDFLTRTFQVEFEQNSATTARNFMIKKYMSQLRTSKDANESLFLLTLDESKESRNMKPVYSLFGGIEENEVLSRQADGLIKLLKTGVFQNACISFRVLGSTNREPGRFIAIDKESGVQDNAFNNKFFGQWFIINVRHIFEAGLYYNEITAVKLHRYKPLDINLSNVI